MGRFERENRALPSGDLPREDPVSLSSHWWQGCRGGGFTPVAWRPPPRAAGPSWVDGVLHEPPPEHALSGHLPGRRNACLLGLKKHKGLLLRCFSSGCVLQRCTCGVTWLVLPRQGSCSWRDETLCSTPPGPKGRLLRHLFFSSLRNRYQGGGQRCQGGGPTKWGAQRPLTSEPGALHCAACEGGKKRRSNRQPSLAARGRGGEHNVPPGISRNPGVSREDEPCRGAAHSPQ